MATIDIHIEGIPPLSLFAFRLGEYQLKIKLKNHKKEKKSKSDKQREI
jgi:hypothetical protein